MPDTNTAFFELDGDRYVGNDGARGPWTHNGCHGGPAAGAVARSAEKAVPDKQLVRLTLDLFRPVPVSGFTVQTTVGRNGRTIATVALTVIDDTGRACASATALLMAQQDIGEVTTAAFELPDRAAARPTPFRRIRGGHELRTFADVVEVMTPGGVPLAMGPNTAWMRTPRLVSGEQDSAFVSVCALADCGNGFSRNQDADEVTFINPDLSINLHRAPSGEWIGAQFTSRWESNGTGLSNAILFDDHGPIGSAQQCLLLQRPDKA